MTGERPGETSAAGLVDPTSRCELSGNEQATGVAPETIKKDSAPMTTISPHG